MGAEESKSACSSGSHSFASGSVDFPNSCRKESEATAWTLLHQCTLDKWKEGHAGEFLLVPPCSYANLIFTEAAGFPETIVTCDGAIHKDCSFSFCMSRQGIININKGSSIFSFRKRSKFAKMAEHFEYNHIPAQMSSVNHFRVKSVLCFHESLVILHLARNTNSQFGMLDLRSNKFLGVFGKQRLEFINEALAGEISPDKTKCLIRMPHVVVQMAAAAAVPPPPTNDVFGLYDLPSKQLLYEVALPFTPSHFCFDPRFTWNRLAVTNFEAWQTNSLSLVDIESKNGNWQVLSTNPRVNDTGTELYPNMKDLRYSPDGALVIACMFDTTCFCREKKTRNYQPISCSIYVFNGDTTATLHCIQYHRYTCTEHNCPINYTPIFSMCGSRMGVVMNYMHVPQQHFVQVYKLPSVLNLQSMCRSVILQSFPGECLTDLPLPPRLIHFLHFKPEFG